MNNNNISETKKYDGKYDILKFVLSLMVLAIHTALYPMILYPWLRIAVPLFFIMSSYFFFSKINISSVTQQKNILKKYVIRNIQLYLCWFIICLPVTLYVRKELFFSNGFLKNVLIILRTILFGDTFVASWFISASIIGVVIIYFLNRWLKNDYLLFFICLFVFCIVTLQSSYSSIINGTIISTVIKKYIDSGLIRKVSHGLYIECGNIEDDLYIQAHTLFIWNLLYKNIIINSNLTAINIYKSEQLSSALNYIHEHYKTNISLDALAELAHLSKGQFCRSFKELTGMSPFHYLIRYRILQSCNELLQTNRKITDIALTNGFNNVSYYNRAFLKFMGMTPKEYRKTCTSNHS